jgi:hypothetical protein
MRMGSRAGSSSSPRSSRRRGLPLRTQASRVWRYLCICMCVSYDKSSRSKGGVTAPLCRHALRTRRHMYAYTTSAFESLQPCKLVFIVWRYMYVHVCMTHLFVCTCVYTRILSCTYVCMLPSICELNQTQAVLIFHVLDPLIRLHLRIDHERPAHCVLDEYSVVDGHLYVCAYVYVYIRIHACVYGSIIRGQRIVLSTTAQLSMDTCTYACKYAYKIRPCA